MILASLLPRSCRRSDGLRNSYRPAYPGRGEFDPIENRMSAAANEFEEVVDAQFASLDASDAYASV